MKHINRNGKNRLKNMVLLFGVIIWIGALSPEIFIKSGEGCIFDEDGRELTKEEAEDFMEAYFYDQTDGDGTVAIRYRIALFDLFR